MKNRIISVFCILAVLLSLCACRQNKNEDTESTTLPPQTTDNQQTTQPGETAVSVIAPINEETTTDTYKFNKNTASPLGKMQSEIYGSITVYFENNHFTAVDEFGSVLQSFSAQGYTANTVALAEGEQLVKGMDLNFDKYSDLCIAYRKTGLNLYYLCFLWDITTKSFVYYEPLASIPNISTVAAQKRIVSDNKTSSTVTSVVSYSWVDNELTPVDHKVVGGSGESVNGPEDTDSSIAVFDGIAKPVVALSGNVGSQSSWLCRIEDESVAKVLSKNFDPITGEYEFTFYGTAVGTTTAVFRYATDWSAEYVAERIVNITVHSDSTVNITVIQ